MKSLILAGIVAYGVSTSAFAGVIYSNESDFLSNSGLTTTETFESYAVGNTSSGALSSVMFDDFSVSSNPAAIKVLGAEAYGNHNTTAGGLNYLSFDTDMGNVGSDVTFEFNFGYSPVTSFGLYFTDTEQEIDILIDGVTYNVAATGDGGESYFGLVSDTAFSSIFINGGSSDSQWSVDDISYSMASVAEPGTAALLLMGLTGLTLSRRKKAKKIS